MTESSNHNQYFYISEQVSKNPPISAFYMECINIGLKLQGELIPSYVIILLSIVVYLLEIQLNVHVMVKSHYLYYKMMKVYN